VSPSGHFGLVEGIQLGYPENHRSCGACRSLKGFSVDRLRMSEALYQQLIDTAVKQFGQIASDNRQKTDSPATIYAMTSADDASLAVAPRSWTGEEAF
jgi:hypothetical protein